MKKKLKTAVKNKTGTTLRMSLKMFTESDLPHELLLLINQKTKLKNALNPLVTDGAVGGVGVRWTPVYMFLLFFHIC